MLDSGRFQSLGDHWSPDGSAISFYYSPSSPQNLAHKNTVLNAKERLRELSRSHQHRLGLRPIFQRMDERLDLLTLEQPRGLVLLADPLGDVWYEANLPYEVEPTALVGNSFLISQLLPFTSKPPKVLVLLLDRSVTRLVVVSGENFAERTKEFGELRIQVRETGTGRKKSDAATMMLFIICGRWASGFSSGWSMGRKMQSISVAAMSCGRRFRRRCRTT